MSPAADPFIIILPSGNGVANNSETIGFWILTAFSASILPYPCIVRFSPIFTAVPFKIDFISSGFQSGWACLIKATTPETIGAAIDVPASCTCLSSIHCLYRVSCPSGNIESYRAAQI